MDLGKMVREGEVAWLHKRDMPGTGHAEHAEDSNLQTWHGQKQSPPSPQHQGGRKRKEPPPGRHSQPATRPSSAQPAPLKQGQHCCQIVHVLTSLLGCSICCKILHVAASQLGSKHIDGCLQFGQQWYTKYTQRQNACTQWLGQHSALSHSV